MNTKTLDAHIEIADNIAGGKPRIAGHRITVQDIVVWHEVLGQTADEVAAEHDLGLADVYAALAYYYDHQEQIDGAISDCDSFVRALRRKIPSKLAPEVDEPEA